MEIPVPDMLDEEGGEPALTSPQRSVDPAGFVAARDLVERLRTAVDRPELWLMFVRTAQGYMQSEIADELEMSQAAVSSAMRRVRHRFHRKLIESVAAEISTAEPSIRDRSASDSQRSSERHSPREQSDVWQALGCSHVTTVADAGKLLAAIEECRLRYEDSHRFPALHRPVPGLRRNLLDLILDGPDDMPDEPQMRKVWLENRARVCRDVVAAMKSAVPSFDHRAVTGRRSAAALRELYRLLVVVKESKMISASECPYNAAD
jgi:hypothetical protein